MTALPVLAPDHGLRRAVPADVPAMADLINRYAEQELMLPKSPETLYRTIRDYVAVVDLSGALVACGGLRIYSADSAEIVGLAVAEGWQGRGLGGTVVGRLVDEARELDIRRVFAMTLSVPFFMRHGFRPLPRPLLPEKERADCAHCPRRFGCRERAVQRVLAQEERVVGPGPHRSGSRPRPRVRSRRARMLRSGGA